MKPAWTGLIPRRALLKGAMAAAGGAFLAACASPVPVPPTLAPTSTSVPPAATPAATPVAPVITRIVPAPTTPTLAPGATPTPRPSSRGATRLIGYLASWKLGATYRVSDVPADQLTHLIYAFAAVSETGECVSASVPTDQAYLPELVRLKQQNPRLQTLISIGGGGGPGHFAVAVQSPAAQERFARSAVAFMKQAGFDGIDLDWEYPSGDDQKHGLALLLAELRRQLDDAGQLAGRPYLLTLAAAAGVARFADFAVEEIFRPVDWLNLMSYAFHGTWSAITNFDAPLYATASDPSADLQRATYNTDFAVHAYLGLGVPADKLVVGVPFFGYGWKGVADVNHGLFQPANGLPPGTLASGVFEYRDLKENYLGSYQRFWHDEAQVPWLYNPGTGVMITYDDPESVGAKADYVRGQGLGGAMIWELTADDRQHSLVSALAAKLNPRAG